MESVPPYGAAATERAVDRLGHADGEALDTARERGGFIRLDEQMDMIGLHAVMEETERRVRCGAERGANGGEEVSLAK